MSVESYDDWLTREPVDKPITEDREDTRPDHQTPDEARRKRDREQFERITKAKQTMKSKLSILILALMIGAGCGPEMDASKWTEWSAPESTGEVNYSAYDGTRGVPIMVQYRTNTVTKKVQVRRIDQL